MESVPAAAAPAAEPPRQKEKAVTELRLDEVWRPRRQGRRFERPRRHDGASEAPKEQTRAPGGQETRQKDTKRNEGRRQRHDRHDRHERRQASGGRREDRPRVFRQSASPTPPAGIDPDSPFAALISLKAALEKQGQE
jgi:ATP-dependent RNA helicase SUPV3L1/SUV3